jgi:hypothetical protein
MRQLQVNDCVRLIHRVSNDFLLVGAVGVIQRIWGEPDRKYEAEFCLHDRDENIREVLEADQIECVEQAILPPEPSTDDNMSWQRYENEGGRRPTSER